MQPDIILRFPNAAQALQAHYKRPMWTIYHQTGAGFLVCPPGVIPDNATMAVPARCGAPHLSHGMRCDLVAGHAGPHEQGGVNTYYQWEALDA